MGEQAAFSTLLCLGIKATLRMMCQRIAGLYKKIIDKAMKTQDMVLPVQNTPKDGTQILQFRAKFWSMATWTPALVTWVKLSRAKASPPFRPEVDGYSASGSGLVPSRTE